MAHQEQHDGGTDSRLGTAWSTFTMLGDTMQKPFYTGRGNRTGPLRAGRIEWWVFSEAHSAPSSRPISVNWVLIRRPGTA